MERTPDKYLEIAEECSSGREVWLYLSALETEIAPVGGSYREGGVGADKRKNRKSKELQLDGPCSPASLAMC